ncbi:unnamed protein product [Danaus chrysippus]|uniref:(African queen) hypothetical protein n=1 Tax=Danaus chrysippus TaxID=151541 RepID=A0A8J2QX95_9NEOP|nr:unnamed protein product [Danaus chrysippus]
MQPNTENRTEQHEEKRASLVMSGSKKFTNHNVDEQNVPIMVIYRKKQVWKQYITSMFGDDTRSEYVPYAANDGYSILPEEIEKALGKAKTGKSHGPDNIHTTSTFSLNL